MRNRLLFVIFLMSLPALACSLASRAAVPLPTPPPGLPAESFQLTPGVPAFPAPDPQTTPEEASSELVEPEPSPFPFPPLYIEPTPAPASITGQNEEPAGPPPVLIDSGGFFLYSVQSGDTLAAVARRFDVEPDQVVSQEDIPGGALLRPGQLLAIPNQVGALLYPYPLLPDSEVIYSPAASGFDIHGYIQAAGGYLNSYGENVDGQFLTGADIVRLVAVETSTNPMLLLSFLEHRSGWVFGQPLSPDRVRYPLGFHVSGYQGLHKELSLASKMLVTGYYGWRTGEFQMLTFPGGSRIRVAPGLNAGSVALQHLASQFYRQEEWARVLYEPGSFLALHYELFGDPWQRAAAAGPILPASLMQPQLELPFLPGQRWSFTGGPHKSWITGTPLGALDFAPVTGEPACAVSQTYATASAAGLVVRSERSVVAIDLDGDGSEQTGWVLFYMHVASRNRVPLGDWVEVDDPIGRPSCEGGTTTGTHVHIARKYNGEWIAADGPLPFILSGWRAHNGPRAYEGYLTLGDQVVSARPEGSARSSIFR